VCSSDLSSYFVTYLKDNLLTIQLATLAINISIISLIISKVQELKQNRDYFDSRSIIVSLKESLVEQLIIIIIGMFVLSMYDAKLIEAYLNVEKLKVVLDVLIISIFYNTLQILLDTGYGLFIIVDDNDVN